MPEKILANIMGTSKCPERQPMDWEADSFDQLQEELIEAWENKHSQALGEVAVAEAAIDALELWLEPVTVQARVAHWLN